MPSAQTSDRDPEASPEPASTQGNEMPLEDTADDDLLIDDEAIEELEDLADEGYRDEERAAGGMLN